MKSYRFLSIFAAVLGVALFRGLLTLAQVFRALFSGEPIRPDQSYAL